MQTLWVTSSWEAYTNITEEFWGSNYNKNFHEFVTQKQVCAIQGSHIGHNLAKELVQNLKLTSVTDQVLPSFIWTLLPRHSIYTFHGRYTAETGENRIFLGRFCLGMQLKGKVTTFSLNWLSWNAGIWAGFVHRQEFSEYNKTSVYTGGNQILIPLNLDNDWCTTLADYRDYQYGMLSEGKLSGYLKHFS